MTLSAWASWVSSVMAARRLPDPVRFRAPRTGLEIDLGCSRKGDRNAANSGTVLSRDSDEATRSGATGHGPAAGSSKSSGGIVATSWAQASRKPGWTARSTSSILAPMLSSRW